MLLLCAAENDLQDSPFFFVFVLCQQSSQTAQQQQKQSKKRFKWKTLAQAGMATQAKPVTQIFNVDHIRSERLEQLKEIFDFIAPEGKIGSAAQVGTQGVQSSCVVLVAVVVPAHCCF